MNASFGFWFVILICVVLAMSGCASDPVKLAPIPAPPPVIVEVPHFIALPAEATTPCPEPQARPIKTDVDLFLAAMAFKVQARCNEAKLKAIGEAQP